MPVSGLIYALDLGKRTGFAAGPPGEVPRSGAVVLKRDGEARRIALSNLVAFLNDEWSAELPELVAIEAPLHLQAFARLGNAEKTVRMTYGLHGVVEAMCERFGIRLVEEHNQTIRKHFLGVPRLGTRDETKRAVIRRCQLLQLMDRDCRDDDRADAISIHDWAAAHHGRGSISSGKLFLFGEAPR